MFLRDWWRIETDFGAVRLELDGAGGDAAGKSELFETERVLDVLTYGIECRHPRITIAILEAFARRHAIDFSRGTSLDTVPPEALDHLRPTLIEFLKTEVRAGRIQLYQEKIPTRKRERLIKFDFAPQPSTREELTFIGVEVKDQDDLPVVGTRVRFELPDGDIKVATTNSEGIARIDGLALPGNAKVSLLDFNEPGNADPVEQDEAVEPAPPETTEPEEPEQKEFTVKVVDETGKGIAGIPMVFSGAGTSATVPTNGSGVAKWKAATDKVDVTFESAESVNQAMKAVWQSRAATPLDAYLAEGNDVVAVTSRPSAVEALGGDLFSSLSVDAAQPQTLSIRPAKKRAVLIEMHDTLFRTGSAVVNPEGEAPSTAVGEHESITTVGLVATILRYNEEHEGKKLFIAGHADRAGDDAGNVKLSEHRAKAVLALVEGKKDDYVAACGAKHSEVDVTQLFDWANRQFGFTCKPTVMDRPPSDENYVKFRKSFNLWVKNGPAEGEKEPRGTAIGDYGRLQPDIWGAMFELYEYNLRDELGEDSGGVATLRQGLTWVDDGKKTAGFGEKHPTTENAVDGMRSQADRRVEVMFFDGGEEPDLGATNGEDIYDGVTFERRRVEAMKTARRWRAYWETKIDPATGEELPARMGDVRKMILEAPGLAAGETVEYEVTRTCGEQLIVIAFDVVESEPNLAELACDFWAADLPDPSLARRKLDRLPLASFSFVVAAESRRLSSAVLRYADSLRVKFEARDGGAALAKNACQVQCPWGYLMTSTDVEGVCAVDGLPPGGARAILPDYQLHSSDA